MTDTPISPLRQRMLEDMTIRRLKPHTQAFYVGAVARYAQHFAASPDQLDYEHVRQYQLHLVQSGCKAVRRFLLHVLPDGFHRIRHYGLLANAGRVENIAKARALLGVTPPPTASADVATEQPAEEPPQPTPCVIVAADGDRAEKPGDFKGLDAADALFDRLRKRVRVVIAAAPDGMDWLDVLNAREARRA